MTCGRSLLLALVSLMSTAALADDGLGKLFFSPAQRAALDAGKQINQPGPAGKQVRKPDTPPSVTLNGVVVRSDGERTVWINGKPYQQRNPDGIRVKTNPSSPSVTRLQIGKRTEAVELRVGQRLDGATGRVREAYELPPRAGEPANRPTDAAVR